MWDSFNGPTEGQTWAEAMRAHAQQARAAKGAATRATPMVAQNIEYTTVKRDGRWQQAPRLGFSGDWSSPGAGNLEAVVDATADTEIDRRRAISEARRARRAEKRARQRARKSKR